MDSIKELILSFGNLKVIENEIRTSANLITESFFKGGKLLLCGNGGSSADCEHIAGEMVKQFTKELYQGMKWFTDILNLLHPPWKRSGDFNKESD